MKIIQILHNKIKIFKNKIPKVFFVVFCLFLCVLIYPIFNSHADTSNINSSVIISATVASNSGGGGGVNGSIIFGEPNMPISINFSGIAYPYTKVYLLKDGIISSFTTADNNSKFSFSLTNLESDTYNFSLYAEDSTSLKSSFFSFPIYLIPGVTVNISNILISPTLSIDKSEIKKGDILKIFGQSTPNTEIDISISSSGDYFYKVFSDINGKYLYNLSTSMFENGLYQINVKSILNGEPSLSNNQISFIVGDRTVLKGEILCSLIKADLNCDNHIGLTDFSIMAYWYKKPNPPQKIDLNNDGIINLIDFSILAFYWNG